MKLFIWIGSDTEATDGVLYAMAENAEQARRLICTDAQQWCKNAIDKRLKDGPWVFETAHGGYFVQENFGENDTQPAGIPENEEQ